MSLLRPESSLLRLSRRGKKRAAGATQFTYGKDRPFVVVPRVTGAKAIRPYEGPGTVQDFRIAPAANVSRYQVPNAVSGQVRILPPRPRARPYHQPSHTETPDQWYGRRGAPTAPATRRRNRRGIRPRSIVTRGTRRSKKESYDKYNK